MNKDGLDGTELPGRVVSHALDVMRQALREAGYETNEVPYPETTTQFLGVTHPRLGIGLSVTVSVTE